jgi:hypothetical protein
MVYVSSIMPKLWKFGVKSLKLGFKESIQKLGVVNESHHVQLKFKTSQSKCMWVQDVVNFRILSQNDFEKRVDNWNLGVVKWIVTMLKWNPKFPNEDCWMKFGWDTICHHICMQMRYQLVIVWASHID